MSESEVSVDNNACEQQQEVITEIGLTESEVAMESKPTESEVATENKPTESEVVTENKSTESEVATESIPSESEVVTESIPTESEVATETKPTEPEVTKETKETNGQSENGEEAEEKEPERVFSLPEKGESKWHVLVLCCCFLKCNAIDLTAPSSITTFSFLLVQISYAFG